MAILWESLVRPADLTAFVRQVPLDQNYTLNTLFPDRYINDDEVNVKDVTITARTAKVRAFDAPPATIGRDTFSRRKVKPIPVSVMMNQGEVDKRRRAVAAARGGSDADTIDAIYDDATNATKAIQRRVELMRGDLLDDGKVTIAAENGVTTEADFGVPGGNIATAVTYWTDPTAPILADLRTWQKAYRDLNGYDPGGIVMSRDIWYLMAANNTIKALYPNQGVAAPILSAEQVNNALASYRLPPINLEYDAQVDVDGVSTRVTPANKIFFVPPRGIELGFTAWTITVTGDEIRAAGQLPLNSGAAGLAAVMDVNSAPPYQQAVYVDSTPLPCLTNPRALAIYKVAA
jgi:hypothetical protein